jgi:hypothetical protein
MEFFKYSEFDCKCGCGENLMNALVMYKLDRARAMANVPFVINSGYRCKTHNKNVGGSPTSSHVKGLAVDIATEFGEDRYLILKALFFYGFTRIGIAKGFIHADLDEDKTQGNVWLYPTGD